MKKKRMIDFIKNNYKGWFTGANTRFCLYILIAVLTTISNETSASSLSPFWSITLKSSVAGFIAWRAYIDGSFKKEKEE